MKKFLARLFERENVSREDIVESVCLAAVIIPFCFALISFALILDDMTQIVVTDGLRSETRTFKKDVSLERAQEVMEQMFKDDYLGLSYSLYVDGEEYCTLEN